MKQFTTIAVISGILCLSAFADVTNEVIVPLTYVGRSTESGASIAYGATRGSEVTAALALPLDPTQTIFDNGAYHTTDFPPSNGVSWASWGFYSGASFQARHFQATFTLPVGLQNLVGFTLFSPYYTAEGNVIPIDDNSYFYLNGTFIGDKGTAYGASNGNAASAFIHETNGWNQDGSFGSAPIASLLSGTNVLNIAEEDTGAGGGTGPLEVMLLEVVPEPSTVLLVLGAIPVLFCLRKRRTH
jgi:hypothetical protein